MVTGTRVLCRPWRKCEYMSFSLLVYFPLTLILCACYLLVLPVCQVLFFFFFHAYLHLTFGANLYGELIFIPFNGGRNRGSESLNNLSLSKLIMKELGFRLSSIRFHSLCSCTFNMVLHPASEEEERKRGEKGYLKITLGENLFCI